MFNKKKWSKEDYQKHKKEILEHQREYHKIPEVREKRKEYQKEYMKRPEVEKHFKEYMKEYIKRDYVKERRAERWKKYYQKNKERLKEYKKNNKNKRRENAKKYSTKYPERIKAYSYANNHKQRDTKCRDCGSTENLQFHHTNYERNEGFTVCIPCHNKIPKG